MSILMGDGFECERLRLDHGLFLLRSFSILDSSYQLCRFMRPVNNFCKSKESYIISTSLSDTLGSDPFARHCSYLKRET